MINYLKHNEIDREQWDNCIKDSRVAKPYAFSWYLDIMSPGWEALIDDDYDSVFPIPGLRKYGIQYISTPIFLQQLGAYTPDKSQVKALNEFLDFIPEFYRLIDLCVGQRIDNDRYKVTLKANYELDLSKLGKEIQYSVDHSQKVGPFDRIGYLLELKSDSSGEQKVFVSVEDTGCGIPVAEVERIFDPFYTTKPTGEGTGLGLSICRKIVELHGGRISCRSEPGKGTCMTITLRASQSGGQKEKLRDDDGAIQVQSD